MGERTGKKPIQKRSNVKCAMPEMNGMKDCFKERSGSPRPKEFFFSRLATRQRTRGQDAISKEQTFHITADENDDLDALIGESDRNNLLDNIQSRIGL